MSPLRAQTTADTGGAAMVPVPLEQARVVLFWFLRGAL